ncbi:MAG: MarR family transcriptional regulator [Myxococcota bacterium]
MAGDLIASCRALYAAIDRLDHVVAKAVGLSRNDLRALNLLEHGPVRAGEVASSLELTTGAVSSLIDRLENRSLVTRVRDPSDRRVVLIAPTKKLFQTVGPVYRRVAEELLEMAERYGDRKTKSAIRVLGDVAVAYDTATARAND